MLQEHFARFGKENHIFEITEENRKLYEEDEGYRQYLAFFPTTTPASAAVFGNRFPTMMWTTRKTSSGPGKFWKRATEGVLPYAGVYHSHNYPLTSYGKRYYDDFKAMYRVYGMVLCPTAMAFLRGLLGDIKHQWGYILRQGQMMWKEKIYWCYYAARRNLIRRVASVRAVRYFSLSEDERINMDRKYSREYLERKR